jgi:hypothetical protein
VKESKNEKKQILISHIRIEDTSTNQNNESQQSGFQKNLGFDDSSIFKED